MKKIIGVAGYMGCGKSTLSKYWAEYFNILRIDADLEAKILMNENIPLIDNVRECFDVVSEGKIDFAKLGKIVFADKEKLDLLNSIVHPTLINHINEKTHACESAVLVDAALLTLWGSRVNLDFSLWIDASADMRIQRICQRNGFAKDVVRQRVESQMMLFNSPLSDDKSWSFIKNESELNISRSRGVEILNDVFEH